MLTSYEVITKLIMSSNNYEMMMEENSTTLVIKGYILGNLIGSLVHNIVTFNYYL